MEKIKVFGVLLVAVLLILLGPLLVLWAINTLFPALAIGYTFWAWLATFILMAVFGSNGAASVKVSK